MGSGAGRTEKAGAAAEKTGKEPEFLLLLQTSHHAATLPG